MIDSCKPRKLEPGLEAIYSRPRDLRTSTMKSDPDRSVVNTSTLEGSSSFGIIGAVADWPGIACGAASVEALATSPAAPAAALIPETYIIHRSLPGGGSTSGVTQFGSGKIEHLPAPNAGGLLYLPYLSETLRLLRSG